MKEATLYSAFRRLEETGQIEAYWGNEETGARRRYYRITEAGKKAHAEQIAAWNEAETIIRKLLDTGGNTYA